MNKNFKFGPWKIGVDVEKTKDYYLYQGNFQAKDVNMDVMNSLTIEQRKFFDDFGIDLLKAEVHKNKRAEDEEETIFSDVYMIRALICGDIYSIPEEQEKLYFLSEEEEERIFPESEKENVTVSDEGSMFDTHVHGMLINFSHPIVFRAVEAENKGEAFNEEKYMKWRCGEFFVKAIVNNK